jgi:hypothetical protein
MLQYSTDQLDGTELFSSGNAICFLSSVFILFPHLTLSMLDMCAIYCAKEAQNGGS